MPELDFEELDFDDARRDLRARIEVPEYAVVRRRAERIRRRRRALGTGVALGAGLACLAVLGMVTAVVGVRDRTDSTLPPADALPSGLVWRGGPISVLGLSGQVLDMPGDVRDVQFADAAHGYALSVRCDGRATSRCEIGLAASADGGVTWRIWKSPVTDAPADRVPQLVTLDPTSIVLRGESTWFGRYGKGWRQIDTDSTGTVERVITGRLRLAPPGGTYGGASGGTYGGPAGATYGGPADATSAGARQCVGGSVQVWLPDGDVARLAHQPDLSACWVSGVPAADGALWVGGTAAGAPAVAVTRDSGVTWQVSNLPGPANSWGQVSLLGSDVYASVVSGRGGNPYPETLRIEGVYRSAAGQAFTPYGGRVGTLIGDVVALLDGKLLAAGPNWYITSGQGSDLTLAGGSLPWVYRLQATPGGWIALDLFDNGWTALSHDGVNWQKINVR